VVKDAQGATVPGARVSIVNQEQGVMVRELTTEADGSFRAYPLNPGTYTVSIQATGFKKFEQRDIRLYANDRINLPNIALEIGAVSETVEVRAAAVQLETESAARSSVITGTQVVNLALNGRNFLDLVKTAPGITGSFDGQTTGKTGPGTINVNGQRGPMNNITLDGVSNLDTGNNESEHTALNVDAVAEFKMLTNSKTADFGKAAGATINVVTKGGTNQFHGVGYWFHRHEGFNANPWLSNYNNLPRQFYRYNYQGYNIGGPVYIPGKFNTNKDKLFFFWAQEWQEQLVRGTLRQLTVPTEAERQGNFALTHEADGRLVTIRDPLNGQPFGGNQIPQNRWNKDGQTILGWFPTPNVAGYPNFNYQWQKPDPYPRRQIMIRGDYNINEKWRLFARFVRDQDKRTDYSGWGTQNVPDMPFLVPAPGRNGVVNLTTIVNPTLTNEFIFGASWNMIDMQVTPELTPKIYAKNYNLSYKADMPYPNADRTGLISNWRWGDLPNPTSTNIRSLPFHNANVTFEFTDNVSKMYGTHQLRAGIYVQRQRKDQPAFTNTEGNIFFSRDSANPGDTNWAYSNALLGNFQSLVQASTALRGMYRYTNTEWFVADTWKARPNLTIDYGIRFYIIQPQYDQRMQISSFNGDLWTTSGTASLYQKAIDPSTGKAGAYNPVTGKYFPAAYIGALVEGTGTRVAGAYANGIAQPEVNGYPRGLIKSRGVHYAPRLGIAWNFAPKTVLRAGAGIFYDRFQANMIMDLLVNPPLTLTPTIYYGNLGQLKGQQGVLFPQDVLGIDKEGEIPTVYQWNLGIQRELPWQVLLDVAYVGSVTRHQLERYDRNFPGWGSAWLAKNQDPTLTPKYDGTTTLPVNFTRGYQGYGSLLLYQFSGIANYNSLQVTANRRLAAGLELGVAYTWSKTLGTSGGDRDTVHPTNIRFGNYAPLAFDRRHTMSINYIYNIPKVSARVSAMNNAVGRAVFDNWVLAGFTTFQSGAPLSFSYGISGMSAAVLQRTITGVEGYSPRVAFTGQPVMADKDSIFSYINPAAFAPAAKGSQQMESALRGQAYSPGSQNWDLSIYKSFPFSGDSKRRIEIRTELFNAPNHPNMNSVNTALTFDSTGKVTNLPQALGGGGGRFGFGTVSGTSAGARVIQFGAKLYF